MKCHYKALTTRFLDEAKSFCEDFMLAATSRPGCNPVHFDFMAWIEVKAPGVLQHLAPLAALDEQEQERQPPLIAPLLRRRAPSTGPASSNGAAPAPGGQVALRDPSDPDDSSADTMDEDPTGSADTVVDCREKNVGDDFDKDYDDSPVLLEHPPTPALLRAATAAPMGFHATSRVKWF